MKPFRRKMSPRPVATDAVATDAFRNSAARMGYATPSLAEGTEYELVRWSQDYWLLITLYRNHWLARRIVELPAQDMCKAWPRLKTEFADAKMLANLGRTLSRTYTQQKVQQAIKWARLFGGAAALMVIDGHEDILDEPLDLDDITPGSYKGLIVFDRWSGITPSINISIDFASPVNYGMPEYYDIHGTDGGTAFRVHHSRILRFSGPDVPSPEFQVTNRWGISVLEPVYEELRKRDNMSWAVLQLLFRAQILTMKEPQLSNLMSGAGASAQAAKNFENRMQQQNALLSNQSLLLLGEDGELQSHQYSFGGVSEIYQQFQMDVSGAAQQPVTRLFGRTATGLGQSNDADERMYEEDIHRKQHEELKPQLDKLYPVICMSEWGEVPDDMDLEFPSIRVLSEEDKSNLAKNGMETILAPFNAGIKNYGSKTVLQEIKQLSIKTEIGSNITNEMIESAPQDDSAVMSGGEFSDETVKEADE